MVRARIVRAGHSCGIRNRDVGGCRWDQDETFSGHSGVAAHQGRRLVGHWRQGQDPGKTMDRARTQAGLWSWYRTVHPACYRYRSLHHCTSGDSKSQSTCSLGMLPRCRVRIEVRSSTRGHNPYIGSRLGLGPQLQEGKV